MNLIINNDFWESLTDAQKEAIEKASADARDSMRAEVQSSEQDYIQKLKDEGMTVTEVDVEEFKAAMEPAYKQMAEYVGNEEYVTKMQEICESCADAK
ncbi:MAG: hypothetical protein PHP50_04030 [Lachnospiraceae bacterium]|nr:hypothetical protein [Lachnospiraceae bacterium]